MQPTQGNTHLSINYCATGIFGALVLPLTLSGCGTMPDAKVDYYHAESSISFKVVRSVLCDSKNHPVVANTVTPTVTHSANPGTRKTIELAKLRGTFSDADAKIDFYEDGRLKAINSTTTGQGETILKSASTLTASLAAMGLFGLTDPAK